VEIAATIAAAIRRFVLMIFPQHFGETAMTVDAIEHDSAAALGK